MIAIFGVPGCSTHRARHFRSKGDAEDWLDAQFRAFREAYHRTQPTEIVSDREAAKRKWLDGTYIYRRLIPGRSEYYDTQEGYEDPN